MTVNSNDAAQGTLTTLKSYLDEQLGISSQNTPHNESLAALLNDIGRACRQISQALNHGALAGILGSAAQQNVQGETQKTLDILSDKILVDTLQQGGHVAALASEEQDDIIPCNPDAAFLVAFDPLDGSSNIDINISVGTIFSILPHVKLGQMPTAQDFFQPGKQQRAAGYVLYGPSTLLILSLGQRVDVFTLDPKSGEFYLTAEQLSVPVDTQEFAINTSNQRHWHAPVTQYIEECLAGKTGIRGKDFNMRWVGSMVGDVHRVLSRGGVFLYPHDRKNPGVAGRLRLLYEASPMSFLVEAAGGAAITGEQRILDIMPLQLHQRVPVMLGSRHEIERLQGYHAAYVKPDLD